jgi:hypothetical protein
MTGRRRPIVKLQRRPAGWELRMLQIQAFAPNNWEDLERFQEKMPI